MPKPSRGQKRQAKTKKRQQRQADDRHHRPGRGWRDAMERRACSPQGFRPLPMIQAMLEYGAHIMAYVDMARCRTPNDALQLGMQLWNFTLPHVPVLAEALTDRDG